MESRVKSMASDDAHPRDVCASEHCKNNGRHARKWHRETPIVIPDFDYLDDRSRDELSYCKYTFCKCEGFVEPTLLDRVRTRIHKDRAALIAMLESVIPLLGDGGPWLGG